MVYKRFEDVPAWRDGIDLTARVFRVTEDKAFRYKGDIANQVQRAGLSIPNNIAEGFERGTTPELITFLYYAKGSSGEVRSICHVIERLPEFGHLKSAVMEIKSLAESVSRQLAAWTASLQDSDIAGPRRQTDQSRQAYQQRQRAELYADKLKRAQEENLRRLKEERAGAGKISDLKSQISEG